MLMWRVKPLNNKKYLLYRTAHKLDIGPGLGATHKKNVIEPQPNAGVPFECLFNAIQYATRHDGDYYVTDDHDVLGGVQDGNTYYFLDYGSTWSEIEWACNDCECRCCEKI